MKLIISIGPDWLGVKYRSKADAKRAMRKAMGTAKPRGGNKSNIQYSFKGRGYNWNELNEAVVLTLNEFHANCINRSQK